MLILGKQNEALCLSFSEQRHDMVFIRYELRIFLILRYRKPSCAMFFALYFYVFEHGFVLLLANKTKHFAPPTPVRHAQYIKNKTV